MPIPLKKYLLPIALAIPLLLTACGQPDSANTPAATESEVSTASKTSTVETSSSSEDVESSVATKADKGKASSNAEDAAEPKQEQSSHASPQDSNDDVVESTLTIYTDQLPSIEEQQRMATEAFFNSPESALGIDPSNVPYADGGTCPAAVCGYGHDENGNPNPSSGEIQSWWTDCIATNSDDYCRANDPYQ